MPARPYRPSWLDALFDSISALPGPTWLAYALLTVPSILMANSALWLSGLSPWGQIDAVQVFWGIATMLILAASHYLRSAAADAFERFRPALGGADVDVDRERYELTTMPARAILVITAINAVITPIYYLADPVGTMTAGLSGAGFVGRFVSEALVGILIMAIAYQGVRQLRRVGRLHAVAQQVDPFSPAPLYAFARLTGLTAAILVGFNALGFAASPQLFSSSGASVAYGIVWLAGVAIVAGAIFLLPLLGMHGRLEAIRDGLDAAAGVRLKALLAELNEAIDARDASRVETLDRSIGALRREREVLKALPTWPWSVGTIRGVASTLALPIVLFLIQRYLSQVLGLMAEIAIDSEAEPGSVARPASSSWVNAVNDLFERLPGPTWLAYVLAMAAGVGLTSAGILIEPSAPVPELVAIVYYAALPFAVMWLIADLDRTASRALATLRPLLGLSDAEIERARRTLTRVPAVPALAITIFAALFTPIGYVLDPVGAGVAGYGIVGVTFRWAWESFVTALFLVLIYHTVRQLRLIGRLHESIGVIDLFDQSPLYALSSVTSTTAMGLILLLVPSVFLIPSGAGGSFLLLTAAWYAFALVIAFVAFFVPLRGVHGRLAADKARLRGEVGRRITGALEAIHRAVDANDASAVAAGHEALSALTAERDLVNRIPTWPWSAGALTRFLSAVLLPIGLWLITRFLERVV